ncbi:MAG: hypothetical protein CMH57_05375 [Myxococcales bacterium]|nr:hypothetical protein [Myxococcales bacterium]
MRHQPSDPSTRRQRALLSVAALLVALLSAQPTTAAPASSDTPTLPELSAAPKAARGPVAMARARALRDAMLQPDAGWGALANAYQLDEALSLLAPSEALQVNLSLADALAEGDPDVARLLAAAHLRHRAAIYARQLGDRARSDAALDQLGLIRSWQVLGPFENSNMSGFDAPTPAEGKLNRAARLKGKVGPVSWNSLAFYSTGYAWISGAVNPTRSSLAYALAYVEVPKTVKEAVLRVGADGAYKVWLDGKLLGATSATERAARLDSDAYGVRLGRGRHVLLFKVATENRGRMGLYARLTDASGKPLDVTVLDPATVPEGTLLASAATEKTTGAAAPPEASRADARALDPEKRARPLMNAAIIARQLRPTDPTAVWRDLTAESLRTGASDPSILLDAATTVTTHWDRMPLVSRAAELGVNDPWVLTRLAMEMDAGIGIGHDPLVFQILDKAILLGDALGKSTGSPALMPRLQKATVLARSGQAHLAMETVERLQEFYPRSTTLLSSVRDLHEQLGQPLGAMTTSKQLASLSQADPNQAANYARLLMRAAQPAEALVVLDRYLALESDALTPVALKAHALHQLKRSDEALALLDEALKRSPAEVSLLQARAQLFEQLDRDDDAVKAYELALTVQPENRALLERVRALKPRVASYEAPYRWPREKMTPDPDAARAHAGMDYYYIGNQQVIHVSPSGQSSSFTQEVIHVLTDEGARIWRGERIYYSPDEERVEIVSVRVRKADGTISESYSRNDYNAFEGPGNLYYQRRYAYIDVGGLEPGDVVEYAYRVNEISDENYREGYFGDLWYFESGVDVEHARYVLLTPKEMTIHMRPPALKGLASNTSDTTLQGRPHTARVLEAKGLSRVRTDRDQPGRSEVYDYVLVSTYKTWDEVGLWWWNLIKDQLIVDAEIKKVVAEVTRGLTNDMDKVKAIHNWVVKNTRYVGIEFGVHGWKPYRTTLAMQRRFGDCKDKASLTKVMLETAGIEANMVLIRTRRLGNITQSPASLAIFDHAISYVPKFDLFLDGTAEFSGTSNLPAGDQGQLAVIVKNGGGVRVVKTPVDEPKHNTHIRVLKVDLRNEPAITQGELTATGSDAVYYRRKFDNKDKRTEELATMLARTFPGASLLDSKFIETSDLERPVQVQFTLQGGGFIKQIGDKLALFPAGREIRLLGRFAPQASRDQDLMLSAPPYTIRETVRYQMPDKTSPAAMPRNLSGSSRFGSYNVRYVLTGDVLETEVEFQIATNRVDRKNYGDFRAWLQEMDRAINQPVVLQSGE